MESEHRIEAAKKVMRGLMGRFGKPHNRIHLETANDNVNRLRALEGLCGHCANLELKFGRKDGKEIVTLICEKGLSPVALYDIQLGEEVLCHEYSKGVLK